MGYLHLNIEKQLVEKDISKNALATSWISQEPTSTAIAGMNFRESTPI